MIDDVVRELGFLTLGSRLKRIGERLQAQTRDLLQDDLIEVPASHVPLLAALDRLDPLSAGCIAHALDESPLSRRSPRVRIGHARRASA